MPGRLIVEMVFASVFWLNSFPNQNGISRQYSPRTMVVGQQINYNKRSQLEFGTYVPTQEEHDNSMPSHTTGAIALRPIGNAQGGYLFMSLTSGQHLNRYNWTVLPMPQDLINRVNILARRQISDRGLFFTNCLGEALPNTDDDGTNDDSSYHPSVDESSNPLDPSSSSSSASNSDSSDESYQLDSDADSSLATSDVGETLGKDLDTNSNISWITNPSYLDTMADGIAGVDTNDNEHNNNTNDTKMMTTITMTWGTVTTSMSNDIDDDNNDNENNENINENDKDEEDEAHGNSGVREHHRDDINADMDARFGRRLHNHGLQPRRPRNFGHLMVSTDHETVLNETILTQHSMKKGIKLYVTWALKLYSQSSDSSMTER
jgi:hypothetical protein